LFRTGSIQKGPGEFGPQVPGGDARGEKVAKGHSPCKVPSGAKALGGGGLKKILGKSEKKIVQRGGDRGRAFQPGAKGGSGKGGQGNGTERHDYLPVIPIYGRKGLEQKKKVTEGTKKPVDVPKRKGTSGAEIGEK